jgi:transcriptional regulator with XRE-family HTH domain
MPHRRGARLAARSLVRGVLDGVGGVGRIKQIGPQLVQRNARNAGNIARPVRRYSHGLPTLNGAATQPDGATQFRAAAGRSNGFGRSSSKVVVGCLLAHPPIVQLHCTVQQAHSVTLYADAVLYSSRMDRPVLPASEHRVQVGLRLRDALKAANMQNVEAARVMGVSKQSISEWIAGRGYPPQYGCYLLHKMTGITYDWLFLGDWSALPARLADKLKPEIGPGSGASREEASQEHETNAAT